MGALLTVGQVVALKADPARRGPIIAVLPEVGGHSRYRVFHSVADIREYDEDQLLVVDLPPLSDALVQAVVSGEWQQVDVFQARLTASRLSHPMIDSLYALHAARIKYVPFQFKPLLRFLRADQPRLLIADEVGVGKTIEAFRTAKEGGHDPPILRVRLCGRDAAVRFSERHAIELQELLGSRPDEGQGR